MQMEAALAAARRETDAALSAAWMGAVLGRVRTVPPLSDIVTSARPARTPEEASLELQAQMRVTREHMAKNGRIRSWSEWQTGSPDGSAPFSASIPESSTAI